jgi:hypothetical protein
MKGLITTIAICSTILSFSQSNTNDLLFASAAEAHLKPKSRVSRDQNPGTIEIPSFTAVFNDKRVNISWSTELEKENDYFTIERSRDGINFETASMVKSYGNSKTRTDYVEVDYNPMEGISYYRLKQTDKEGKISYSAVVPVNYHFGEQGNITIFPNPTDGPFNINFELNSEEEVLVVIKDLKGEEFYSKVFLKAENNQIIAVDPERKLASGTYMVLASSENKIYSHKLIVK